ncbi:hypothetical protein F2Q69_00044200 [Brassica cretica]|uniref:Pentacotripeptide-repeat region of PRORP domain-containing protein n=1 Tax=Brassica cretica TaxID=69181 RepID=A0A8S9NHJ7_BRACR|nr:hypothetical protein F2Q69_00044200 [Brassica cretica]
MVKMMPRGGGGTAGVIMGSVAKVKDHGFVRSALLDMYGKCGFISEAMILFHKTTKKTTVTFNSMIFCYANHGLSEKAVELFEQMEATGERLDHLTFTAILTACSHGGLTDLGQKLFLLMQNKYRIEPRLEHYACMVDLLGRAGKVVEAYEMISAMLMEPDLFVWGALLGACRNHGNIELARIAAERLAELEPENSGNRLLLSSLYANAGSWGSVVRMKKMIKKKKLSRVPGSSWVVSGNVFVAFVAASAGDAYYLSFSKKRRGLIQRMGVKAAVNMMTLALASATELLASHCIEMAEQAGADRECVAATVRKLKAQRGKERQDHTSHSFTCSHGGLTDLGQKLFLLMQNKYRIEPRLEHYACMVDLLGRAGKVVEAYEMISAMLMEPDLFVWGALLGACRNHGNIELARIAAERLAELEPENSGNRLLLSSLYANAGSWGSVVRMKKMIKKKKLSRVPGSSWVNTV